MCAQAFCLLAVCAAVAAADTIDVKKLPVYARIRAHIDTTPAIDTHEHLRPWPDIQGKVATPKGIGINLYVLWKSSYYTWNHPLAPWPKSRNFDEWWGVARDSFKDAHAASFFRYQLPAFTDLYGVDFESITDEQARDVNTRIYENYQSEQWIYDVVTEKSNIELMFVDPYWDRLLQKNTYPFSVAVLNVTRLLRGFHPSEYPNETDSPYRYAREHNLPMKTLDDYLAVIEQFLRTGKEAGAVCLKTTTAYERTLEFENVAKEKAEAVYGRPFANLSREEAKAFEDYIMWQICAIAGKLDLPFQIHTGQARIQSSSPMNLINLIEGNPNTKFILFHGGYPWIGETGAIMMRYGNHVWIDSCWLPTLSYTMAKRAYQEWLEVMPSNKIMWGSDAHHVEGTYGATVFTRQCLAEALAEKVERGELREQDALRIGAQVMRDNALELFPQLKDRLWKGKTKLAPPKR